MRQPYTRRREIERVTEARAEEHLSPPEPGKLQPHEARPRPSPHSLLDLQAAAGNRATARFVASAARRRSDRGDQVVQRAGPGISDEAAEKVGDMFLWAEFGDAFSYAAAPTPHTATLVPGVAPQPSTAVE